MSLQVLAKNRCRGIMAEGEWCLDKVDNKATPVVCCPGCGKIASLADHTILHSGDVFPALLCPFKCGFHEFVQLADWVGVLQCP